MDTFNITEIEKKLGYTFENKRLLMQAFTRSSYSAEHIGEPDNEVLEFIGDSVLGMLVAKRLATRYKHAEESPERIQAFRAYCEANGLGGYPEGSTFEAELDEDEMSQLKIALVRRASLAAATAEAGLEAHLRMGKSDLASDIQSQDSVREDLFEAIIGAVAMDSDWNMHALESLVERMLRIDDKLEYGFEGEPDYEADLATWAASAGTDIAFETVNSICEELPVAYYVNLGKDMLNYAAYGYGKTEQGARRMAAKRAMEFITRIKNRADAIATAVGAPDPARAVNQLHELWQKGLIPEPKYTFAEHGKSESGNTAWTCICVLEGLIEERGGYICDSKSEAKRQIAFDTLNYLLGRDLSLLFTQYGIKKEKE